MPQDEINRLLVGHARAGRRVVRLKGGDPFVFGRGGEEALVVRAAGIPFEVVPGVTSGVAAPAYAGIPVTHRDAASGVAFVTGHEDPDKPSRRSTGPRSPPSPARSSSTWACASLPRIAERLTANGRPSATSRSRSSSAARSPGQRTVLATLADVAYRAAAAGIRAPAITLVGPVARLHEGFALARIRAHCTAARSPLRAPVRRRARSPRACAASARR